ncbi:hypothetical protein [Occallatibacter riparius]|uniref:Secreted protein n=1 Tax=Occallatibacter riparius TaxID=1002689 RepID=A0A9J7BQ17_9BACT|nr:hypothetical protein [Occallatibacter riparius]UWZ84687.1 hypothetical protein MOP44_01840 [Occallatibacter riparius]
MKTFVVLIAIGMLGSGLTIAQQAAPPTPTASTQFDITPPHPCSVAEMRVRQGGGLQMLRSADGDSKPIMTPGITLKSKNGRPLVSATVTVHGTAPGSAVVPAVSDSANNLNPKRPHNMATTVQVKLREVGDGSYSGELTLSGFGVITTVDLKAMTYADGTSWKAPAKPECSVAPDPLLLVSER